MKLLDSNLSNTY